MEIINEKNKIHYYKGFYKNLSESDIKHIFTYLRMLITWLQVAGLEAGSWPNFPVVPRNEDGDLRTSNDQVNVLNV